MRNFNTGATRDSDESKFDYEGFMNPLVLERFAAYMHKHRVQADGSLRDSDNWQKGIPKDAYMKSMFRHFMDVWKEHRGIRTKEGMEEALTALMFNAMGLLYETLREGKEQADDKDIADYHRMVDSVMQRDKEVLAALDDDPVSPDEVYINEYHNAFPTHRYGALADDPEAIRREIEEAGCEAVPSAYTSVRSVSNMVGGEVLGVPPKRPEGEVATLAPKVCGSCGCETCVQAGCKW